MTPRSAPLPTVDEPFVAAFRALLEAESERFAARVSAVAAKASGKKARALWFVLDWTADHGTVLSVTLRDATRNVLSAVKPYGELLALPPTPDRAGDRAAFATGKTRATRILLEELGNRWHASFGLKVGVPAFVEVIDRNGAPTETSVPPENPQLYDLGLRRWVADERLAHRTRTNDELRQLVRARLETLREGIAKKLRAVALHPPAGLAHLRIEIEASPAGVGATLFGEGTSLKKPLVATQKIPQEPGIDWSTFELYGATPRLVVRDEWLGLIADAWNDVEEGAKIAAVAHEADALARFDLRRRRWTADDLGRPVMVSYFETNTPDPRN